MNPGDAVVGQDRGLQQRADEADREAGVDVQSSLTGTWFVIT